MSTNRITHRLSATEHARVVEAAKQRAIQARREAIDEFWSAVGSMAARALAKGRQWFGRVASLRAPA